MHPTVKLRRDIAADDLVVAVLISSHHLTGLVGGIGGAVGGTLAHKRIDAQWDTLEEIQQSEVLSQIIHKVCDSAGVAPHSLYLSRSETSLFSRLVVGDTDFQGVLSEITDHEMQWSLRRAEEKPVGTEQELIDLIPVRWELHGEITRTHLPVDREERREARHRFPLGEKAKGLSCHALQIVARRGYRAELERLAKSVGLHLDGVIAQPAALYRGIASALPERGWSLVIDCGARHTSFLLRSGDRLLRIRTFAFGGDDLTAAIAEELQLSRPRAEALKLTLDISQGERAATVGQQTIWTGSDEAADAMAPQAARIVRTQVRAFFEARAHELQDDPDNPLPRRGSIHLVGRGAQLGGLTAVLGEIFGLGVVLGSGKGNREIGEELDNLLLAGLLVSAIDQRRAERERHGQSLTTKAGGVWSWLTRTFE
jgi:cell division ATPase FtsA